MTTHLIIPDAHAHPDTDNNRFEWLGKFIMDRMPDKIICMGDMADMPSLCSYDVGKRSYEGRRYWKDIEAVRDAQKKLFSPLIRYNINRKINKKAQYKPELHLVLGNHEDRINKAIELDAARLEGIISIDDLEYNKFGWKVYPFKEVVLIDGVAYSHYFISGVMGQPIGGIHPAHNMITKQLVSCTAGHSHVLDTSVKTDAVGKKLYGLHCGVFDNHKHDYAGKANDLWWRGIVMKHNVRDGQYDIETISIDRLEAMYG